MVLLFLVLELCWLHFCASSGPVVCVVWAGYWAVSCAVAWAVPWVVPLAVHWAWPLAMHWVVPCDVLCAVPCALWMLLLHAENVWCCFFLVLELCWLHFCASSGPVVCVFGLVAISGVHALVFCALFWLELSVAVVAGVFVLAFCVFCVLPFAFTPLGSMKLILHELHWFLHWFWHTNLHQVAP